jgi:cell division protein YceG involved in septum cleavage
MADRVAAVHEIAIEKRGVLPRLTRAGYMLASGRAKPPVVFRKDWAGRSIEGFLFPSTYEFSQYTPSAELVRDQLATFKRQWSDLVARIGRPDLHMHDLRHHRADGREGDCRP